MLLSASPILSVHPETQVALRSLLVCSMSAYSVPCRVDPETRPDEFQSDDSTAIQTAVVPRSKAKSPCWHGVRMPIATLHTRIRPLKCLASRCLAARPARTLETLEIQPDALEHRPTYLRRSRLLQSTRHHFPACCVRLPISQNLRTPNCPTIDTADARPLETVQRNFWHRVTDTTNPRRAVRCNNHWTAQTTPQHNNAIHRSCRRCVVVES